MTEQEPREDQWPLYPIGPNPHMHALGVIAINFNLFEASLFGLFSFVLQKAGFSEEGSSALFLLRHKGWGCELTRTQAACTCARPREVWALWCPYQAQSWTDLAGSHTRADPAAPLVGHLL